MSAQPKYKEENFYSEQELGSKSKKVNLTDLVERMKEEEKGMDIKHIKWVMWLDWMYELSKHKSRI